MDEYISRRAAREAFENADADVCESYPDGACDWGFGMKNIQEVIDGIPAADVEPVRHGRWERCLEDWRAQIEAISVPCADSSIMAPVFAAFITARTAAQKWKVVQTDDAM